MTASGQQQGDKLVHHCDRCKDIERCKRAFGVFWVGKSYGGGCNTGFPDLYAKEVEVTASEGQPPEREPQKFSPPPGERKTPRPTTSRPKFARKRRAIQEEMI